MGLPKNNEYFQQENKPTPRGLQANSAGTFFLGTKIEHYLTAAGIFFLGLSTFLLVIIFAVHLAVSL